MAMAFALGGLVMILGTVAIFLQERGGPSTLLTTLYWVIPILMLVVMGWMLYRALLARPRCPECRGREVLRRADYFEPGEWPEQRTSWRRYRCDSCGEDFVIPSISFRG